MSHIKNKILVSLNIAFLPLLLFGVVVAQDFASANQADIEEASALIQTMTMESAAEFLAQADDPLLSGIFTSMDTYTAIYYLNFLTPEDAKRVLLAVPVEKAAAYLSVMESHTAANACQSMTEEERINIFLKMDKGPSKNIYALLNLPKIVNFKNSEYSITQGSSEIIEAKYDNSIPSDYLIAVSGNESVLKISKIQTQDNELSVELIPVFQGSTTFTIETIYGRVLSDPVVVVVNAQKILFSAVPAAASGASGVADVDYSEPVSQNYYVPEKPNTPNSQGQQVWITKTGECYHFDPDCVRNPIETTMENAIANYRPCSKCAQNDYIPQNPNTSNIPIASGVADVDYSETISQNYYVPEKPNTPNSQGQQVWITKTGECYHFDPDCVRNPIETTMENAIANYRPCSKCAW